MLGWSVVREWGVRKKGHCEGKGWRTKQEPNHVRSVGHSHDSEFLSEGDGNCFKILSRGLMRSALCFRKSAVMAAGSIDGRGRDLLESGRPGSNDEPGRRQCWDKESGRNSRKSPEVESAGWD